MASLLQSGGAGAREEESAMTDATINNQDRNLGIYTRLNSKQEKVRKTKQEDEEEDEGQGEGGGERAEKEGKPERRMERETGGESEGDRLMVELGNEAVPAQKPWWPFLVLFFAVLAVSSAGAVMKSMDAAASIARASWRLQGTSLALFPAFLWDLKTSSSSLRKRFCRTGTLGFLTSSAVALGFHFGLWVYSIDSTSLPHSLLFVCTPPIFLVLLACWKGEFPSPREIYGMLLGMLGVCIMILGLSFTRHKENDVTFLGDFSALMAALAFVVYLTVGSKLRSWMPLFMYAFPVTLGASLFLLVASWVLEEKLGMNEHKVNSPFGWISKEFFWANLYLSLGPGLVGHTGINAVLKHVSPLLISMAITAEPLLGSFIGWAIHVSEFPKLWTCVGGSLLIFGILVVNFAGEEKRRLLHERNSEDTDSISLKRLQSFDEEEGMRIFTLSDEDE